MELCGKEGIHRNQAVNEPSSRLFVGRTLGMSLGASVVGVPVGAAVVGTNGVTVGDVVGCSVVGNKVGLLEGASVGHAPQTPHPRSNKLDTSERGTQMVSS